MHVQSPNFGNAVVSGMQRESALHGSCGEASISIVADCSHRRRLSVDNLVFQTAKFIYDPGPCWLDREQVSNAVGSWNIVNISIATARFQALRLDTRAMRVGGVAYWPGNELQEFPARRPKR